MRAVFWKELRSFLSSLIAYLVISVFLVMTGLFMWVFKDSSLLEYNYAGLEQLFSIGPMVFIFLIPAVTMRSFSEEHQQGTIELLATKPLTDTQIILGKYFANVCLVILAILPTLIYYFSVYQLGSPKGNIDTGAVIGSYIGLMFLASIFVAIGLWASSISSNQIVSFILAAFLCFVMHWAFAYLSNLSIFFGTWDDVVQKIGISHHYNAISKGKIDSQNVIYFISVICAFIWFTHISLAKRKWA